MNRLKIIYHIVLIAELLMIVTVSVLIVVVALLPEGKYIDIEQPYWEVTSRSVRESILPLLPPAVAPMAFSAEGIQMSLPATLKLKVTIIASALLVSAYMTYLLELFKEIVNDVMADIPFTLRNTRRVKLIGALVTAAPLAEWLVHSGFSLWLENRYQYEGLQLVAKANLGWPVFILGLMIVVLGVAFEQGQKIQEDNQLTI